MCKADTLTDDEYEDLVKEFGKKEQIAWGSLLATLIFAVIQIVSTVTLDFIRTPVSR